MKLLGKRVASIRNELNTQPVVNRTHFLSLKMKLKAKQTRANTTPAIARRTNIVVRGRATVTVSFIGIPSLGMPSAQTRKGKKIKRSHIVKWQAFI